MNYLNEIIGVLSGGLIVKLFDFFISTKKVRQDEFSKIVEQWQKDNDRLREENKQQSEKINHLVRKLANMEFQINLIDSIYKANHKGKGLFDSLNLSDDPDPIN
jgi:hypothetical protein